MRPRKPTLDDVARLARVSKSAASRILRTRPGERSPYDPNTRERVRRASQTLGYVPSRLAQGLTHARTGIIGLTIPSIEDSFFPAVTAVIENRLAERGFNLILADTGGRTEIERKKVEDMLAWRVDGLIAAPCQESSDPAFFWELWLKKIPFVLIDRTFPGTPFASVTTDDRPGAAAVIDHMIARGCRRIARAGGPLSVDTNRLREEGFRESLARHGLAFDPLLALDVPQTASFDGGRQAAAKLFALDEPPDGIFCFSDRIAAGVIEECLTRGVRIPEDVAVAGYADLDYSGLLRVPLTTVRQSKRLLGTTAADMLLKLLEEGPAAGSRTVLPVELILRESTAGKKPAAEPGTRGRS
ncbi:MAG TPA: LacI family DNA-binding transcriptional regulator [Planctomycetota bacterium]|nr:LacI family DNA-binding transcriptional regulator [Planctomycetota bacterium]OQC19824.1 MAG: Catabolite control protein A [Planctomycetes bacterium ADurb.Bin069]NMD35657.1 LacI family transcriptional regulator [Planctomycetota bacterium]HNS00122.1 LacI family DNA-binding transcriptional regulator [Planctomycetota bacterium]HNU26633.1 LacI family DNA-binding transcriptional regulator [Planctomycetota bacterium]